MSKPHPLETTRFRRARSLHSGLRPFTTTLGGGAFLLIPFNDACFDPSVPHGAHHQGHRGIETRIDEWGDLERLTASRCINCHKPETSEGPRRLWAFSGRAADMLVAEVNNLVCLFQCSCAWLMTRVVQQLARPGARHTFDLGRKRTGHRRPFHRPSM